MGRVGSAALSIQLGLWLLVAASGCASFASGEGGKADPRVSRKAALARCIDETPQEILLYPDALAACMEGYGWVYAVQGRR